MDDNPGNKKECKDESLALYYMDKLGIERRVNAYYENNGITKTLIFENQVDEEQKEEKNNHDSENNQLNQNYMNDIENQLEVSRNTSSHNTSSINSSERNTSDEEGFGMVEEKKEKKF